MIPDEKDQVLKTFNAALQSRKLYPPGHPSIAAPARKTCQFINAFLKNKSKLTIGIAEDALICENIPVPDGDELYSDLFENMQAKGVEAVIFEKGVKEKEVGSMLDLFSEDKEFSSTELQDEVRARSISHITLKTSIEERRGLVEIYDDAVDVVKNVMNDIRVGKIPDSTAVKKMVSEMEEKVFSDTNAMIGLTMIKNYDDYLFNHSVNVSILSMALGRHMKLKKADMVALGVGSLLHDVGKTGVSEDIIKKPGGLSSEEFEKIKEHPEFGNKIAKRMNDVAEASRRIILEHHVRHDHTGYPHTETDIHPLSQLVTIADAYDALTTLRVYKKPNQPVDAIKIIKDMAGRHFEPKAAAAFVDMVGVYPVGTMVRLSSNEVGAVTEVKDDVNEKPTIKILFDAEGRELKEPRYVDLTRDTEETIIGPVDPLSKNMDMGKLFKTEAAKKDAEAKEKKG